MEANDHRFGLSSGNIALVHRERPQCTALGSRFQSYRQRNEVPITVHEFTSKENNFLGNKFQALVDQNLLMPLKILGKLMLITVLPPLGDQAQPQ